MGEIWMEVCLISARGVRASPSLWKRQWYAVGWVDPKNKYCTKVDASGNANPLWRTKFALQVHHSDPDLALNVEVYSRDPVFLTEKLHGSATVLLREFLAKQGPNSEEVGSYQLRNKKSNKPRGFVDVSIRVSQEKEDPNFHPQQGDGGGIVLLDHGNNANHLTTRGGFGQTYPQQKGQASFHGLEKQAKTNVPYPHPVPFPADYTNPPYVGGPSYQPPPAPPSNVGYGYAPTYLPNSGGMGTSYFNMPTSSSTSGVGPRQRGPPGFAIGAGAGALAAGAVMFGDNFVSGFDVPSGLGADPTLTIATDPLF